MDYDANNRLFHLDEDANPFVSELDEARLRLSWNKLTVRGNKKKYTMIQKFTRNLRRHSTDETVAIDQRSIEILKAASGYAEAGHMVAVMGPSGAGKTTLLEALAKRIKPSSGMIRVNGIDVSRETVARISSYVPQFDPLPDMLTVAEYIAFSCALRLDRSTTFRQRRFLARETLLNISLYECKDSLICALSGGEKKRLSLAAEIVTKPRILFLDEPTTGLDTSAALRVIESVKPVSTNGIILCSIHQPSMTIYKLFTHVIFLTDGKTAFAGSLKDARIFFKGEGYQCPFGFDEAEYYVKILSNRPFVNDENTRYSFFHDEQASLVCEAYARSSFSKKAERSEMPGKLIIEASEKGPRWIVQFNWLLWRLYLENRRTFMDGLIAFQYYAISIVAISIFFWNIDAGKQRGIQDAMGVLYMASTEAIFSTAYTPLYEIEREIPLYQREVSMYGPSAYYIATVISWIPKAVCKAILVSSMLFMILGAQDTVYPMFLQFCLCAIASSICGTAYGSMIASFIEDNEIATAVMVPLDLIAMLMAGIYYSLRTLKWYTVCFKYISIFYYTTEALSIAYWSQIDKIDCDNDTNLPCISTGSEVLFQYGYEESDFWIDILGMLVLTILMNFMGYLGARRRRRSLKSGY